MPERLPPLNALRAFEAAARHLSFTRAAQELHVTPGAVSHQVKGLEDFLGVQLFHRLPQALALTQVAHACLPDLKQGFASLSQAVTQLAKGADHGPLTVRAAPAFATKWLVPRLPRFTAAHPDIDLRISASLALVDVLRKDSGPERAENFTPDLQSDLTIRFGLGEYADHEVDLLCSSSVTALCSPRLLKGPKALKRLEDLAQHTLLHDDTVYFDEAEPDWAFWLRSAKVEGVDVSRGPRFNNAGLAIAAAADGLGVALGMPNLAEPELASKRLVMPFEFSLPSRHTYYLVRPKSSPIRPAAAQFREWLLKETRGTGA
ncbi:MAG: transcriptional regulator GcvA [Burkholderiales bacterium]